MPYLHTYEIISFRGDGVWSKETALAEMGDLDIILHGINPELKDVYIVGSPQLQENMFHQKPS